MGEWQDTLDSLKERFKQRAAERLRITEDLIGKIEKDSADLPSIRELRRHFHWFAGSGGTYGYPQITKLGLKAEEHCDDLLSESRFAKRADLKCWRELSVSIKGELGNPGQEMAQVQAPAGLPEQKPTDVLVVDSEQQTLLELGRTFEDAGMSVRTTRSISGAMQNIAQSMPDAIITESTLPDGPGYELVEKIRELPRGDHPVVIIVSKIADFVDKVKAIHAGADAHFPKTTDWDAILTRLNYLLSKKDKQEFKILSVEDEPDHAEFIRQFFSQAGYEIRVCTDPKDFEESVSGFHPDLILLDVNMPGMTGYEVARFIRQDDRFATLPIVFLTARSELDSEIETIRSGGDDHLVKPVDPRLLITAVSSRLERAQFMKSLFYRDGLTRLLSHGSFLEQTQAVVASLKRNPDRTGALILFDIDHMGSINQAHGYTSGDKVIVALSGLLKRRLRQSDLIGRISGQQFSVVLEDLIVEEAVSLIEQLRGDFARVSHVDQDGLNFAASFSAGAAMFKAAMSAEDWLEAAGKALAEAKSAQEGAVRVYR